MQELIRYIVGELRGTWRFRWYALLIAWIVALAGSAFVLYMPDEYRVEARVQLDTQSMLRPLLEDLAVQPNPEMRMRALTSKLLRRENLERIASTNDLLLQARSKAEEARIMEQLERQIRIRQPRNAKNIYRISYKDSRPERARGVVQSVVDILMAEATSANLEDSQSATEFLEQQVNDYEDRLQQAEQRLAEFRRENVGMLPDEGGGNFYNRLNQTEATIEELESELKTARRRRRSLEEQLASLESGESQEVREDPRVRQLQEELRSSQEQLDKLLTVYTEEHPDVEAQRERIERRKQRLQELRQEDGDEGDTSDGPNPVIRSSEVYQEFQLRLNDIESEMASLQTRLERKRQRRDQLLAKVDEITKVEKRLKDLTRNYESIQRRYQTLLNRLQTARMTSEADRSQGQTDVRLVEPPRTPQQPDGPPRTLFMLGLAPVSLGIGGSFAFLLHLIRPVFQGRDQLGEATGRPVLGSVSLALTRRQRRVKLLAIGIFTLATVALLAAIVLGALYADSGTDHLRAVIARLSAGL